MKISVVTVCFNSEATIEGTIRSFLAQSYPDKEMIVIDGQSRDRTVEIIKSLASDQIWLVSERDRGIYDAMNKGLRLYTGDAVGFLNSDDTFHDNDVLSKIAAGLSRAEAVHSGVVMVKDHKSKKTVRSWKGEPFRRGSFRWGWMPPHPTFYIRRDLASRVGIFDLRYSLGADYDFMLRALELHAQSTEYVPGPLVDFMAGGATTESLAAVLKANLECSRSRREHLGVRLIDPALILKPLRKVLQQSLRLAG